MIFYGIIILGRSIIIKLFFMKRTFFKIFNNNKIDENLINEFMRNRDIAEKLPKLSDIEKIKLDQESALEHLYYSSKIEGVHLDASRMGRIINAQ